MTDRPATLGEMAAHMVQTVPQAAALGLQLIPSEAGRGQMYVPWREDLVGDPDNQVIAGGVVTALLDHCCGLAVASKAMAGSAFSTATLDLRIDYMRPAGPRQGVTAKAHCYKLTRTVGFVRAQAFDDDPDDPIATAQAAFFIRPVG